jgi:hypothetical protein
LRSIWPGWFWTLILLISTSWEGGITGKSHQCAQLRVHSCTS